MLGSWFRFLKLVTQDMYCFTAMEEEPIASVFLVVEEHKDLSLVIVHALCRLSLRPDCARVAFTVSVQLKLR